MRGPEAAGTAVSGMGFEPVMVTGRPTTQVDRDGRRRKDFRLDASADTTEAFAQSLGADEEVVLEATFHSWAIWRRLRPRAGRLLRTGFIPEVQLPEAETWELRQLVSHIAAIS